jgi:hypothetical protein
MYLTNKRLMEIVLTEITDLTEAFEFIVDDG